MIGSILVFAAAATAPAGQGAQIECIRTAISADDRRQLTAIVIAGGTPRSDEERTASKHAAGAAFACTAKYGWSETKTEAAFQYTLTMSVLDNAEATLARYKLSIGQLRDYTRQLDGVTMNRIRSGNMTDADGDDLVRYLSARGASFGQSGNRQDEALTRLGMIFVSVMISDQLREGF